MPVHPHMRGELAATSRLPGSACGSSPHAWGTLAHRPTPAISRRFIPTCVGNSMLSSRTGAPKTVQPHMRGELCDTVAASTKHYCSSPHAWGTRARPASPPGRYRFIPTCVGNSAGRIRDVLGDRFIPTCVGNSTSCLPGIRYNAVHPHMRGELGWGSCCCSAQIGSSPHAWGTHSSRRLPRQSARFIPTCVVNSLKD